MGNQELQSAVLAENLIRPNMGLNWVCTIVLSWILTVYIGINSQPSLIQSISVSSIQFLEQELTLLTRCYILTISGRSLGSLLPDGS